MRSRVVFDPLPHVGPKLLQANFRQFDGTISLAQQRIGASDIVADKVVIEVARPSPLSVSHTRCEIAPNSNPKHQHAQVSDSAALSQIFEGLRFAPS